MTPLQTLWRLANFFGLPFLVSWGFWLSPWVGWPTLLVFGVMWLGNIALIVKD